MGSTRNYPRLLLTAALMLASMAALAAGDSVALYADARKAFQEAYARAASAVPDSGGSDSEALKRYPLYPYLEAARIRQGLNGDDAAAAAADKQAAEFLTANSPLPVGRILRRAWLDSLARRSQWALFLEAYRDPNAADATRCQSFVARIELGKTEGLAGEIAKEWLTPHSLPECDRAFAWAKDNGVLTTALIEERARLALEGGNTAFARQIIQQLPAERTGALLQWAALLDSPTRVIDGLISSPDTAVEPVALLAGWTRLARTDPAAARERFLKLTHARGMDREAASPYALALALALAWNREPSALEYFDLVAPKDLDDAALEWRTRTALWIGDWKLASKSIAAMSQTDRQTARWRYWAARAAAKLHDSHGAEGLYESLLKDDNYYSALAATRLNRTIAPHPQALPVESGTLATIEKIPAFERARELFLCGMRPEALTEWQVGFDSLSPEGRLQSIHLAADWGWYDQAVAVASAEHVYNDYDLLYPRPFDAEISAASRLVQLAPEILYGVLRQESLYRADAVSTAGARGLMQLQLETARTTARFWKRPRPMLNDLFDPSVNTSLGAGRLRMLLDRFDGQLAVALAGYNAGPNAATRWLPQEPMDADVWVENIPYNETRGYVQRILWHSLMFTWLRSDGEAQQANSWLEPIKPLRRESTNRVAAAPRH